MDEIDYEKNRARLTPLTIEQLQQLHEIEMDALCRYSGSIDELESAFGFLRMGMQFGWKPLAIVHSKRTFKKYETILGINAKQFFPEETASSERSQGYKIVKTLSNFWRAVSGEVQIADKREINLN